MSAPALLACCAAALCLGVPVIAAGAQLEAGARAAGAADASALAAADALTGWVDGEPCELAAEVSARNRVEIVECTADPSTSETRVRVRAAAPLGGATAAARAGPRFGIASASDGRVEANGWAWPSDVRAVTQHFHDGTSIDLAVSDEGALYAPYEGTVVLAGPDGYGPPQTCVARPEWWRGRNHTVIMRHEYRGQVLYSSHNHVRAGSSAEFGISKGSRVRAGQRVATSGMSGCTGGPHTHFTLSSTPSNSFPDLDPFDYLGKP